MVGRSLGHVSYRKTAEVIFQALGVGGDTAVPPPPLPRPGGTGGGVAGRVLHEVAYDDDDEMERVKASQVQAVLLSELLAEELAAGQPVEQPAGQPSEHVRVGGAGRFPSPPTHGGGEPVAGGKGATRENAGLDVPGLDASGLDGVAAPPPPTLDSIVEPVYEPVQGGPVRKGAMYGLVVSME